MPVSTSLRFEIFARDGFVCQYCGHRPPDVVLEVDHVHPVSKGGTDDSINLITACFGCNRGKAAKVLSNIAPRPDADLAYLREAQIAAEMKRFLKTQREANKQIELVCQHFRERWRFYLMEPPPDPVKLTFWVKRYGPDELEISITRAGAAYRVGRFYNSYDAIRYVGGILKSRDNGGELPPKTPQQPPVQPAAFDEF